MICIYFDQEINIIRYSFGLHIVASSQIAEKSVKGNRGAFGFCFPQNLRPKSCHPEKSSLSGAAFTELCRQVARQEW